MQTNDETLLLEAIDLLHKSGSIEYAQNKAKQLLEKAWTDLSPSLPGGDGKQMLEELSLYLIDRDL